MPKTFTLHVTKLTFDYNAIDDFDLLPAHLEKDAFATPLEYKNKSRYETDTTNPGLYFGPYKITQVVRGQYVVLEPNPTWYGAKPAFAKIIVKSIDGPALSQSLVGRHRYGRRRVGNAGRRGNRFRATPATRVGGHL